MEKSKDTIKDQKANPLLAKKKLDKLIEKMHKDSLKRLEEDRKESDKEFNIMLINGVRLMVTSFIPYINKTYGSAQSKEINNFNVCLLRKYGLKITYNKKLRTNEVIQTRIVNEIKFD